MVCSVTAGAGNSNIDILGKHMSRMPNGWLFDETINCYMRLLQVRVSDLSILSSICLTLDYVIKQMRANIFNDLVYFFGSFFFEWMFPEYNDLGMPL